MFLGAVLMGQTFSQDKPAPATAAPPVEIKGHHIGETIQEFMIAKGTPQRIQECAELLNDPATAKRYEREPKVSAAKISAYGDWLDFKSKVDDCKELGAGLRGEILSLYPNFADHTQASMTFVGNKLVQIRLRFPETQPAVVPAGQFGPLLSFDDILRDLTAKFGPPNSLSQRQMQNGFGAVFTFPVASWTTRPDVRVSLTQDPSETTTRLTTVEIQDRTYGDKILQTQKDRPNALQ